MKNTRKLNVDLDDILNMISCAEDYGFKNDILFGFFRDILETLTDEEIENYCQWYLSPEGKEQDYSIEDYEKIKERLTEFKKDYFSEDKN